MAVLLLPSSAVSLRGTDKVSRGGSLGNRFLSSFEFSTCDESEWAETTSHHFDDLLHSVARMSSELGFTANSPKPDPTDPK